MVRHILHLHIPAFAIAVARLCRPELRHRPVAVAARPTEQAPVLSVSQEARAEGVFKGMPLGEARKRCPALTVLPPDPRLMQKASGAVAETAGRFTPLWEPVRPGHVYLDVTGTERLWGKARDTGDRLRQAIKDRCRLSASVGLAANKMVSSIASRMLSGEGLLDVDHGREARFLAPLRVNVIPGIEHYRRKRLLEELHIFRVRQLAALDMGRLKLLFGRQAPVIHQRSLGIDPTPVFPARQKPCLTVHIPFSPHENDDERLVAGLYRLVERAGRRLRQQAVVPRRAGLIIRYADHKEIRRQLTLPHPTFWDAELYPPLARLFLKACRRRVRVRALRLWFADLGPPDRQLSLFAPFQQPCSRNILLSQALDRIRERHGEAAVRYGRPA